MKTKIKQLTLVAGAVVLGVIFTMNVFTANAETKTVNADQSTISTQMGQSSVADIYAIGDESKCGEGKCGEGKTAEKKKESKKSEKKKEAKKAEKKKTEKKKAEAKCGEGKCG